MPTLARRTAVSLATGLLICQLALATGCGNSRAPVASLVEPASPEGYRTVSYPLAGVRFRAPRNWNVASGAPPLVTVLSSGMAVVAVWRYPRIRPLPSRTTELRRARAALTAATRRRDRKLQVLGSKAVTVDGAPAFELDAIERIAGQRRRVRSTHVFATRSEIVLDEYAPIDLFSSLDRAVFVPVGKSMRLLPAA